MQAFEKTTLKVVKQNRYKVGDKVKIVDTWVDGCKANPKEEMDKWLGKTMTVRNITIFGDYRMVEDIDENIGNGWVWNDKCIEGKVIEETEGGFNMQAKYPNLELLVYKAKQLLSENINFKSRVSDLNIKNASLEFDVEVFPQIWGSTCTGFDVTSDGEPMIGGSAMTKAYTTVVHELRTDFFVVFFDDRVCYIAYDVKKAFLDDLANRCMASSSVAKQIY